MAQGFVSYGYGYDTIELGSSCRVGVFVVFRVSYYYQSKHICHKSSYYLWGFQFYTKDDLEFLLYSKASFHCMEVLSWKAQYSR